MKKNPYKSYSESQLREELEALFAQWDDIRNGRSDGAVVSDGFRLNTIRQSIILVKERLQTCSPIEGQMFICFNDSGFSITECTHNIEQRATPPELPLSFSCTSSHWKQLAQKKFLKIS